MTFDILHSDIECDCIKDTFENGNQLFARKISKPSPKSGDFKTYWERDKRPLKNLCVEICQYKGISINYWNENSENQVIEKYVASLDTQIQGGKNIRDCILVFRFKEQVGLIMPSPTKKDPSHCTFYKCDSFDIQGIEEIKIIEIKKYVKAKQI